MGSPVQPCAFPVSCYAPRMSCRFARFSLLVLVPLVGCRSAQNENTHFDDARNPLIKQAQADLDANNPEAAANDDEQALAADPNLTIIYYRLGMLEGEKLKRSA